MKPVKILDEKYVPAGKLDMNNRKVALGLNLVGLASLFVFGRVFFQAAAGLRPEIESADALRLLGELNWLGFLLGLFGMLILHELAHGLFFWIFTRERPKFGFNFLYAYAAAPNWYIPRNEFIIIGLAPFLLITLLGLILLPYVSSSIVPVLLLLLILNAAGSTVDLIVVFWLLTQGPSIMVRDVGPRMTLYKAAPPQVAALSRRWLTLAGTFEVELDSARQAFADLVDHYSESGRYYHNLDHVEYILDTVAELETLAQDYRTIQLAAWFHDVIYDPRARDNEARSAEYARNVMEQLGIPGEVSARVTELIRLTATHKAIPHDVDAQILLDADLSPLGADDDTFERQSLALRQEISWIPEEEYRAGRVKLMNSFLQRERIFQTNQFFASHEAQARRNMTRTIAALS